MTADQMKARIESALPGSQVLVETDGHHYEAVVVWEGFRDQPRVKQHKLVYAPLRQELEGLVHALALRTYTPDQWEAFRQQNR